MPIEPKAINLYLSEVKVLPQWKTSDTADVAIDAMIEICTQCHVKCCRSAEFSGYPEIEQRIQISQIFVALIDDAWMSSTWKGFEYTYASGGVGLVPQGGSSKCRVQSSKCLYDRYRVDFE
ncbi:MAG: hypothetical protein F6J87_28835 [Spirulina sp. SIO3F2]|nr:hypothetical protein [Spirulina sp. SIO3F2]